MDAFTYEAADEAGTAALGRALAELLPNGTVVGLYGTLGAGKTRLVQAIAEACGVDRRQVVSPTFVLIQQYQGRRTIYHLDAYRVQSLAEFLDLGPDEYFESDALVLVEWADRVEQALPAERIQIDFDVTGPHSRRVVVRSIGLRCRPIIEGLQTWNGASQGRNPI